MRTLSSRHEIQKIKNTKYNNKNVKNKLRLTSGFKPVL